MKEERLRVLVLDDEESVREPLKQYLENDFGYQVDTAANEGEALQLVEEIEGRYDVALIDEVLLKSPDGIQVMQKIKGSYPHIEVIIFTGWGRESRQQALQAGAFRYLAKPFDVDELAMLVRTAAQQVRLQSIGRAILSERDPDRVLDSIVEATRSLALADQAAIVLLDRSSGRLRVHTRTYPREQQWQRHLKDLDLSRKIIGTGQVEHVPDTTQDERVDDKVINSGIRSFLGMPIPGEGGNLGVLYVYSRRAGRFEEWGAVAVLRTLAGQAGLAIANAQAFQRIRSHAGYLEALVQAGQGLTKATRLEDQLNLAWDFVREQLRVSTFFVALYDRPADKLSFPLFHDEGETVSIPDKFLGSDRDNWGITGHVVRTGEELHWSTEEERAKGCASLGIKTLQVGEPCQSCFFLPLKVGDEVIGAISIQSYEHRAFTPILLNACRALGSQLTVAVENVRLLAQTQRWAADLETLQRLAATVASRLDLQDVLEQTCKAAVEFFRADHSGLVLFDSDLVQGTVVAEYPPDVKTVGTVIQLRGVPHEEKLVREGEPLVVYDIASEKGLEPVGTMLHKRFNIRSILIVPVVSKGKHLGSFSLDAIGGQRQFTQEEVDLCKMFAAQVAVAIENAHLFEEVKEHADKLAALYETGKDLTSTLELDILLQLIAGRAARLTEADKGLILLVDTEEEKLIKAVGSGFTLGQIEGFTYQEVQDGISGWVLRERMPTISEDILSDPRNTGLALEMAMKECERGKSIAVAPLSLKGKVIGTLTVIINAGKPTFSQDDLDLVVMLASQAAIAIDNAQRVQEMERMRQAAETMAEALDLLEVLQRIARSARKVLHANSSAIWSYDSVRNQFIPEELVADGISRDELGRFRKKEPKKGGTADTVLDQGWVGVTDVSDPQYDFMGPSTLELLDSIGAKSFQGAALRIGDEKLGVLYVNYNRCRSFSEEERATLETFVNHAALALKKARLLEQVGRARDAARSIANVMTLEDLPATLESIVKATKEVADCDAVTLYAYNQDKHDFVYPPTTLGLWDEEGVRRLDYVDSDSVIRRILALEHPHIAEDAPSDSLMKGQQQGELPSFVTREAIKSSVGLPLKAGDRKVGVMFASHRSRHQFSTDELTNIELFANQAAVAIRNAQLYQAEERHAQALKAIQATSAAVSAVLELDILLPMITDKAAEFFTAPATSLMLWDEQKENLVIRASFGLSDEYAQDQRIPHGKLEALVKQLGLNPIVFNIGDEPIGEPELVTREELCNVLAAPLTVGTELIGVLNIYGKGEPLWFGEKEKELAAIFANHAAGAIQNARLFSALRETSERLEGVISSTFDAVIAIDAHSRVTVFSKRAEEMFGYKAQEMLGQSVVKLHRDIEEARKIREMVSTMGAVSNYEITLIGRKEQEVPVLLSAIAMKQASGNEAGQVGFMKDLRDVRLYQERLRALINVSKAIGSTLDLGNVLEQTCKAAVEFFQVDHCGLVLFDPGLEQGRVVAEYPPDVKTMGAVIPLRGVPYEEKLVREGEPLVVYDVANEEAMGPISDMLYNQFNIHSVMHIPVASKGKPLGSFSLDAIGRKREFTHEEVELCKTFAAQVAVAIDNARLYEELSQAYEDLKTIKGYIGSKTAVEWIRMVSTAWGHGIRREVGTALAHVELLRQMLKAAKSVQDMEGELSQLQDVIESIRRIPITAPLSYEDAVDSVRINELLEAYLKRQWKHSRYGPVQLHLDLQEDLDSRCTVRASRQWLRRALEILVENSVEAMLTADSPRKRLAVATRLRTKEVEISIADTGPGIPEDVRQKLFEEPIDKPAGSSGAGIGLLVAKTIVETYGGDVHLRSWDAQGTTMAIVMPVEA